MFKRLFPLFFFLFANWGTALATHIRGGYITANRLNTTGYSYEFFLTIFRDTGSDVTNNPIELYPDINSSAVLKEYAISVTPIPGKQTERWVYRFLYTYSSPGIYTAYHYKENRNIGVLNMSNSDQTTFYVETKIIIDPFLAPDQTPTVNKPAIDVAALGSVYRYNPAASDPDGDSISYQLVPSRQFIVGTNVSAVVGNYQNPAIRAGGKDSANSGPATMTLNPVTGDLIWNVPRLIGEYNTAIKIIEWRKKRTDRPKLDSIGYVILDIQIKVVDTKNHRPILRLPKDTCIVARSKLEATIFAQDQDQGDKVNIRFYGELDTILPLTNRANFYFTPSTDPPFSGDFVWQTNCTHVRKQPYYALFDAEDIPVIPPPLVDVRTWRIKVVGPAPILKKVEPAGNGILKLSWQKYICDNAQKIQIYRKIDSTDIRLDTCNPGMPPGLGFVKIAEVAIGDTAFLDNNAGNGLKKGPMYCYRMVVSFPDPAGGESLVSNEICQALRLDIPVITNVSVTNTSANEGSILVKWTTPFFIDTNLHKPPFTYQLLRYEGNNPPILVKSTTDTTDTTFVDNQLNTELKTYRYQLRFLFGSLANLVDSTPQAAAVRLELKPGIKKITLQWAALVPWSNDGLQHYIYRKSVDSYVLIDSVSGTGGSYEYTDLGTFGGVPLSDTVIYCYYVEAHGSYSNPLIATPLINFSQINCSSPTDTLRPCSPPAVVVQNPVDFDCNNCENLRNQTEFSRTINWKGVAEDTCGRDVVRYKVYYSEYEEDSMRTLAVVADTFYVHAPLTNLAGCYAVTTLDRSGNESFLINRTCVDNCIRFDLPNLMTSNGDKRNDLFSPICISKAFIKNLKLTIYNRWGKKVFEDDVSSEINWGGFSERTSQTVVSGIYFFLIEAEFKRLRRTDEKMRYRGWIDVLK